MEKRLTQFVKSSLCNDVIFRESNMNLMLIYERKKAEVGMIKWLILSEESRVFISISISILYLLETNEKEATVV